MSREAVNINTYPKDASSVLLLAPSLDDPDDEACIELLGHHEPEETNVLSVTTSETPDERLNLWKRKVGSELPNRTVIVDAGTQASTASQTVASDEYPSISVDGLPDNADLVDLGMTIARHLGEWESTSETTFVCLHSITPLFESYERDRVVTLLDGLNDMSDSMDAVAHHHLDPTVHSEEIVATLRPLYDVVIEYIPDHGWTMTEADPAADAPSFRSSTAPPGGAAATDPDNPETIPIPYSFDTVLTLISKPRRRTILYHLKDRTKGTFTLDELVDRVMERETAIPARKTPDSREQVLMSIAHTHLPKLEDVGVLTYDTTEQVIDYEGNPALESALKYVETLELG